MKDCRSVTIMSSSTVLVLLSLCTLVLSVALPKPDHKSSDDRVEKEPQLSDEEHTLPNGDHNFDYDHEAFLGEEEAKRFDDMDQEDAIAGLSIIYDKIDVDKDGKVSLEELTQWIKYVQSKYIRDDVQAQWSNVPVNEGQIDWEDYVKNHYGAWAEKSDKDDDDDDDYDYKKAIEKDRKRWEMADADKDGRLNLEEFTHFLHPEDVPHMKDIVINETMDDIDVNGDGVLTLEEYIEDIWPNEDGSDANQEPDWVKTEREHFTMFRDRNKDGVMDLEEVKHWIMPEGYDHTVAEAKHLMHETDVDRDDILSKQEVLDKYDVFVGSQATDFGEALRRHTEF